MTYMNCCPTNEVQHGFEHNMARTSRSSFPVHMEVIENENDFRIIAELPGMSRDKIKVGVQNSVLTISGERQRTEKIKAIWSDRFFGSFERKFKLPETINISGVSADYQNGLLEILLPKKEEVKPRQIEVSVN